MTWNKYTGDPSAIGFCRIRKSLVMMSKSNNCLGCVLGYVGGQGHVLIGEHFLLSGDPFPPSSHRRGARKIMEGQAEVQCLFRLLVTSNRNHPRRSPAIPRG